MHQQEHQGCTKQGQNKQKSHGWEETLIPFLLPHFPFTDTQQDEIQNLPKGRGAREPKPFISGANCVCGCPPAVGCLPEEVGRRICTPATKKHFTLQNTLLCVLGWC